jgi:hypothetical protein
MATTSVGVAQRTDTTWPVTDDTAPVHISAAQRDEEERHRAPTGTPDGQARTGPGL